MDDAWPQQRGEAMRVRQRLVDQAFKFDLWLTQGSVFALPKRWWQWPFGFRRVATIRLWQHPAGNRLYVKRIHDTEELRLLLGYANLIGWEVNE